LIGFSDLSGLFCDMRHEVEALFDRMDQAYETAAAESGFVCSGCADTCCRTRFYHHTLIEYCYLHAGFAALAPERRASIRHEAAAVTAAMENDDALGRTPRAMCPLNFEGRCVLYAYRPMICRLHGIPHIFTHPIQGEIYGPGCHEFESLCGKTGGHPLDRTPFYREMARLEQRFRHMTGVTEKMKKTVAEMLVEAEEGGP
jgi:hypothetical protein